MKLHFFTIPLNFIDRQNGVMSLNPMRQCFVVQSKSLSFGKTLLYIYAIFILSLSSPFHVCIVVPSVSPGRQKYELTIIYIISRFVRKQTQSSVSFISLVNGLRRSSSTLYFRMLNLLAFCHLRALVIVSWHQSRLQLH